ncbi:MAG: CvpA family protein [Endozoicomonas sp. (ex Botrylloides leachii)]|nr:CvpA family protein [Endozoicomonas sp. (ex Botrylloides leachii)]
MNFTWIDWVIFGVILVSAGLSLRRGFFKEVLSVLSWAGAAFVAWAFGGVFADKLVNYIDLPSVRISIASILLFISTLLAGAFINQVVCRFVEATGFSGTDRVLGMVFGGLRGCLVIMVLVSFIAITPLKQETGWKNSILLPHFIELAHWSKAQATKIIEPILQKRDLVHPV